MRHKGPWAAPLLALAAGCLSSEEARYAERPPPAARPHNRAARAALEGATFRPGFDAVDVFTGLEQPTAVRFAPDGRVFVAEKSGVIKVFPDIRTNTATVVADLRRQTYDYWDRGMLGLAVHPDFPATPYVYVLYAHDAAIGGTAPRWGTNDGTVDVCPSPPGPTENGCVVSGRLSRLTIAGNVMSAEQVLIENWCQQYPSHSVGGLAFGPDGQLYVSGGEGASFLNIDYGQFGNPCGDPNASNPATSRAGAFRAQNLDATNNRVPYGGKVLRVDPITGAASPGNPLAGSAVPGRDRVVAVGFRNPYRFTFRPGTSELWVGDVGEDHWEEIDRVPSPAASLTNFGWPCYEGSAPMEGYAALGNHFCNALAASPGTARPPFYAYHHDERVAAGDNCAPGSSSISALAFYDGGSWPAEWRNALLFGDYSRGCIWSMRAGADGLPDPATRAAFVSGAGAVVDLVAGPGGDLFYVDVAAGAVRRIVYFGANTPPTAAVTATPPAGPAPLTVRFSAAGSTDPDPGDALTYAWDLDGDGQFDDSTEVSPTYTYALAATVNASVRVTDARGLFDTESVRVTVGSGPPVPTITAPLPTLTWAVGTSVRFAGRASDPVQGTLPASAFQWTLVMMHCPSNCHEHVIRTWSGVTSGSFAAPDHEYPSHLVLRLRVTNAAGLTGDASVAVQPRVASLVLRSLPAGMTLSAPGATGPAPFGVTVIENGAATITAVSPQTAGGLARYFQFWSDKGAATHTLRNLRGAVERTATYGITRPGTLPPPWLRRDFSYVEFPGRTVALDAGSFLLTSTGTLGDEDAFNFTYRTLAGDGEIIARVTRLDATDPLARAAVMIRESTYDLSRNAAMVVTPGDVRFQRRLTEGVVGHAYTAAPGAALPRWIRLVRSGSTFTGHASADGVAWTQVGPAVTIPMASTALVGLGASSEVGTVATTAIFDNVQVIQR